MFPTIDKQRIGQRIRMLMKQQNITVKKIADKIDKASFEKDKGSHIVQSIG